VLWTYHNVCGHWHDGSALAQGRAQGARHRGNQGGQAFVLRGLGAFAMSSGAYAERTAICPPRSRRFASSATTSGSRRTDVIMGQTFEFGGRYAEALSVMSDALLLSSNAPNDPNMALVRASALNGSAWNNVQLGDLSTARAFCLQAIELCRSIGYSPGEAGTWDTLGVVWQRLGDHSQAKACFLNAVTLDREMGNRFDLAMVLLHLGDSCASTGDIGGAGEAWKRVDDHTAGAASSGGGPGQRAARHADPVVFNYYM